jgi:hypothetical protein
MNMTKRAFFRKKNMTNAYSIYENVLDRAHDMSSDYYYELKRLRESKDEHRAAPHIWNLLSEIEYEITTAAHEESYIRCQMLSSKGYLVDLAQYRIINFDIVKLTAAANKIRDVLAVVEYLERKELDIIARENNE